MISENIKLSVIIISFNVPALLKGCLLALADRKFTDQMEILIVRNQALNNFETATLEKRFQNVHWIWAPSNYTIPQMRRLGITRSRGEIVALLEDDCVVTETWSTAVIQAHQEPYVAIGGAVEPGPYRKGLDWAVYFCEYIRFMLPLSQENVQALAGNNVSYKRTALMEFLGDGGDQGFYEVFVHWQLKQAGQQLKADPAVVVHNVNVWRWPNLLSIPFHHGRGFAGMRLAKQPLWRRLPFLSLALLLPVVQVSRIIKHVLVRRRYILRLVQALPFVMIFLTSWSTGEFVGYLLGPGQSLHQWR